MHLAVGGIIMRTNKTVFKFKTADPFRIEFDYFNITGMLVIPEFYNNVDCELKKLPLPGETISEVNTLPKDVASIILVFELEKLKSYGCRNMRQLEKTLDDYKKWIVSRNYPPASGLLFLRPAFRKISASVGSFFKRYTPSIPIALARNKDLKDISNAMKMLEFPAIATMTQEPNAWKRYILSPWFQTFMWTFFTINVIFILHALGSFIYIWLFGSLEADLRTLAFVAGFLAVVLDLVVIPSNFGDLSYHIIIQISTILCSIAFYFLLVIWCSLKLGKQIERRIRLFRIVIHIGFAMRIIIHTAVLIIVAVDCYDTDHIVNIIVYNILGYFLISQQLLTALIFAYFTVVFYLSMKNCISESLRNALARVSILPFINTKLFDY
ncbi:hypothetical protein BDF19DRAFT_241585 [Syncephalis fuscata]|nr:hypothetical protein BDF19DRAFT_241585 [Syncephalis fuscata]